MAGLDFGAAPAVLSQGFSMPAPAPTGGMFGGGKFGLKEAIAMGLAGFVSRRNPQLLQGLMQALLYKQKMQADQQERQQTRQQNFDDQIALYDYKLAHPEQPNNDTVADYNFWKGVLPPDQFQQYVANKVNPPQLMDVPGVGIVSVPRMAPSNQIPSAPVGKLTPMGGPSPGGSGGFL